MAPGGTERLVVELVRRAADATRQAVCCLDAAGAWGDGLRDEGVTVHVLNRQPGFHVGLAAEVARVASSTGAQILHCHQYSPFVYGAFARLLRPRLRVLFTEHGRLSDTPPSRKRRLVNPVLAHAAHRIFSVSHDLRRHMISEGLPAARIEVIPNGIDPASPSVAAREGLRRELGADPATVVLITVARLDPVKDLSTLLSAVSHAKRDSVDVMLVVVGDGPERAPLESAVAALGLTTNVVFLGHREDARRWLNAADLYVSSSVSEGISLTILEGMSAGLPVIATSVGGTPEIVDASCGILVTARDGAALGAAIAALARDPGRRERLGATARARVLESFTLDRMVDSYRRIYQEVY